MNYGSIKVAKMYLPDGTSVPEDEAEIRRLAYEAHRNTDEFLAAHSFRLSKNYTEFSRDEWAEVLRSEGAARITSNVAAYAACLHHGLL